jgi:hypothetical protein
MKIEMITSTDPDTFNARIDAITQRATKIKKTSYKATYDRGYDRVRYSVLITYVPKD